jgi:hypothetical protein
MATKRMTFRQMLEQEVQNTKIKVDSRKTLPWDVEPFVRIPIAFLLLKARPECMVLYAALCYRWWRGRDTRYAGITVASRQELAEESGLTLKQVRSAAEGLESNGWLKRVPRGTKRCVYVVKKIPPQMIAESIVLSKQDREHAKTMYVTDVEVLLRGK